MRQVRLVLLGCCVLGLAACGAPSSTPVGQGTGRAPAGAPVPIPAVAPEAPRIEDAAVPVELQGMNVRAGMMCVPAFDGGAATITVRAQFIPGTDLGTALPPSRGARTITATQPYPTAVVVVTKAQCLALGSDPRLLMLEIVPSGTPGPSAPAKKP